MSYKGGAIYCREEVKRDKHPPPKPQSLKNFASGKQRKKEFKITPELKIIQLPELNIQIKISPGVWE